MTFWKEARTVLICGSRHYSDYSRIFSFIRKFDDITVIAGACRGADTLAVRAAKELGFKFKEYSADWSRFGKSAGPKRNQTMIDCENPDLVVAFHDDIEKSKGTKDMIQRAINHNIKYIIIS